MTEIGGFSTTSSSQERNALVLLGEEHGPVGALGQGVDVGWGVLKATLLKIVMLVYLRVSLKVQSSTEPSPSLFFSSSSISRLVQGSPTGFGLLAGYRHLENKATHSPLF